MRYDPYVEIVLKKDNDTEDQIYIENDDELIVNEYVRVGDRTVLQLPIQGIQNILIGKI